MSTCLAHLTRMFTPTPLVSLTSCRDAYEVCSLIPDPNERHECYSVFGLDAQQMANYYETVVRLEQQLDSDIDTSGEQAFPQPLCSHSLGLPNLDPFLAAVLTLTATKLC